MIPQIQKPMFKKLFKNGKLTFVNSRTTKYFILKKKIKIYIAIVNGDTETILNFFVLVVSLVTLENTIKRHLERIFWKDVHSIVYVIYLFIILLKTQL